MAYVSAQSARAKQGRVTPTAPAAPKVITPVAPKPLTPASTAVVPPPSVMKPGINVPGVNVDMSRLKPNARSVQAQGKTQEADARANVLLQRQNLIQTQREQLNKEKADLEANHQAGLITDEEYNAHKTEHQNRDALLTKSAMRTGEMFDIASNTATQQDRFLGGTIRALDPKTGKMQEVKPDGTPAASKDTMGVIEQSARKRLAANGFTPEEIDKRLSDPAYIKAIRETASNTGLGGSFDDKGNFVPAAGKGDLNNPAKKAADKREADKKAAIENTVITKEVPTYDSEGNVTGTQTVTDWEATNAARDELAQKQAAEDAHNADVKTHMDANRAATTAEGDAAMTDKGTTVPTPSLENFIATLPPEQQDQARAYLQPIETFYDNMAQSMTDRTNFQVGQETDGLGQIQDYADRASAKNDYFAGMWKQMQDKALQGKLDAAQSQREMDQKELAYQQAAKEAELNRAIRRQMVQNEKDRKDQLMGLGLSGGWRSTRISADTIFALGRGEELVSDMQTQLALSHDYFDTQSFKIESTYNSTVSQAYDTYEQNGFEAMMKFSDKADEIENTVYSRTKDKKEAINKLETDWFTFMANNGENKLKMIREGQDNMMKQIADTKNAQVKQQETAWNQAMKYIDTYGTQNKSVLATYEKQIGLTPGSLSNQKTIEELKMKKAGGGGGGGGLGGYGSANKAVDEQRAQIQRLYPHADGKLVDTMVYASLSKLLPKKDLLNAYSYMSANTIGKQQYRIQPMLTAKEGSDDVAAAQQQMEDQRSLVTGEKTVDSLLNELQNAKDNSGHPIYTQDDIVRYMGDMGYVHTKSPGFLGFGKKDIYTSTNK